MPFTRRGTLLRSVPTSEGDVKLWEELWGLS